MVLVNKYSRKTHSLPRARVEIIYNFFFFFRKRIFNKKFFNDSVYIFTRPKSMGIPRQFDDVAYVRRNVSEPPFYIYLRRTYIPNIKALDHPASTKKNFEIVFLCSYFPTCDTLDRASVYSRGII